MNNQYEVKEDEKSRILNLHEESTKRQYLNLNEQTTYYKGSDGKVGVQYGPLALPLGSVKIDKLEYDRNLLFNVNNFGTNPYTTTTTTVASVVVDTTTQKPYVPQKPNPIIIDLQTTINSKTQSGLKEDGFLGKKTKNAIYNALVGTLTNQNTTQTTTVAPQPVKAETGTASPSDDK
jgi:hypothetical protein